MILPSHFGGRSSAQRAFHEGHGSRWSPANGARAGTGDGTSTKGNSPYRLARAGGGGSGGGRSVARPAGPTQGPDAPPEGGHTVPARASLLCPTGAPGLYPPAR